MNFPSAAVSRQESEAAVPVAVSTCRLTREVSGALPARHADRYASEGSPGAGVLDASLDQERYTCATRLFQPEAMDALDAPAPVDPG